MTLVYSVTDSDKEKENSSRQEALLSESEERSIILKVQSGDKDLFRKIVTAHKDLIFAMLMRQTSDPVLSEDLAQEVFVKAYLNIKRFRFESRFSTWLARIALNHVSSYFASRKFKTEKMNESFDSQKHDFSENENTSNMENEIKYKRLLDNFQECLNRLKPKFRDVLVLCGLQGQTYEEAAKVLGVPVGTIRSRLNKARLLVRAGVYGITREDS